MRITQPAVHQLLQPESSWIENIIRQNTGSEKSFDFSLRSEAARFIGFSKTMVWAYPLAHLMRWHIRRNKKLRQILQFPELLPVRNNIEKGSFAYDSLLFRLPFFKLLQNKSHLANLVCLAILFGDEFIDGIADTYGKENTGRLLKNEGYNFDLLCRETNESFELYYAFDICELLPQDVLHAVNTKYEISYARFYQHLLFLLAEMNRHLKKLEKETAKEAALLVCKVCNLCFDTYKTDVAGFHTDYTLEELLHYQKSKDDDIINILLTLRAVLLDKRQLRYQKEFSSWSSMVRCMQLYDDMEDAAKDCDFQMNLCCWFARNYFPEEWAFLQQEKEALKKMKGLALNASIALNMPGSCILAMQYARHIACTKLNWVQRKITNYLWRKNWLGFNNPLINTGFSFKRLMQRPDASAPMQLHYIKQQVSKVQHEYITDEMKQAWVMDVALMDPELRKYISAHCSKKAAYYLKSCFLENPLYKKAALFKALSHA
ncbi:MAG: hypothetical protein U0V75_01495 [Ferruginibacter sp.]